MRHRFQLLIWNHMCKAIQTTWPHIGYSVYWQTNGDWEIVTCPLGYGIRLPRGQRRDLDTLLLVPSVSPAPRSRVRHPRLDVVVFVVVAFLLGGGRLAVSQGLAGFCRIVEYLDFLDSSLKPVRKFMHNTVTSDLSQTLYTCENSSIP